MTYHPSDVRTWAQETGYPVPVRGRLSYDAVSSYLLAHPQVARPLAVEHAVNVSARGKVSRTTCEELALVLQ
jgi:hypothetical protein